MSSVDLSRSEFGAYWGFVLINGKDDSSGWPLAPPNTVRRMKILNMVTFHELDIVMRARHLFCLLSLLVFTSCFEGQQTRSQDQPLTSPSGRYVLTVPIETAPDQHRYRRVTISDRNGHILLKDDSPFVGNLNVYWSLDNQDRVWLKNSDAGSIYYWQVDSANVWRRHRWEKNENNSLSPPESVSDLIAFKKSQVSS